jgi:hypothetical protein
MQDSYDFCSSENVRVGSKAPEPVQDAAAAYASHGGIAAYVPPAALPRVPMPRKLSLTLAIRLGVDLSIVPRYG